MFFVSSGQILRELYFITSQRAYMSGSLMVASIITSNFLLLAVFASGPLGMGDVPCFSRIIPQQKCKVMLIW